MFTARYGLSPCTGITQIRFVFNPLNAELNPICHLLALLGGATIVVVSRLRVKGLISVVSYMFRTLWVHHQGDTLSKPPDYSHRCV